MEQIYINTFGSFFITMYLIHVKDEFETPAVWHNSLMDSLFPSARVSADNLKHMGRFIHEHGICFLVVLAEEIFLKT